ncbi:hypothetical protein [Pengzhenrongella frigida]|uniref:Uncharacterized protein n=1 Tax=Pengzhenrongella frigida TaxID=1259133 RepID=A0A4Q5N271_9MICO|nr:hypothetical protein [Cellulomonas sp. HLT2-17]RYV52230.1 hypothetical protein EUA98_04475 [Cellulomonas sp. HLT2-17]
MAVASIALAAGCSGTGNATDDATKDPFAPTGAPSEFEQIAGAEGEDVPLGSGLSVVVPAGSTAEPVVSKVAGSEFVMYRMPDADAEGFPVLQLSWGKSDVGAIEGSWTHETTMTASKVVSDYERSSVTWPGADVAVTATWTEEIARDSGTIVADAAALWFDAPDGTKGVVMVFVQEGTLEGSTALDALQTLTIG